MQEITQIQEFEDAVREAEEIPQEEFEQIKDLKIVRACTLIKRLSPPPFTPLNHFGCMVELENG